MGSLLQALFNLPVLRTVLRPITRLMVGLIAIPIFRFLMRKVFRMQGMSAEFEKDLEQWFRGALLLLAATANMEHLLFGWLTRLDWLDRADWLTMGLRLMLAIGVIEAMPDQNIFAVIHPGPPRLKPGRAIFRELWRVRVAFIKGILCRHLNRSSPVLAMMCAIVGAELPPEMPLRSAELDQQQMIFLSCTQWVAADFPIAAFISGQLAVDERSEFIPLEVARKSLEYQQHRERWIVGWVCYGLAIIQYLIIGLITSRDRTSDVLEEFDRAVAQQREELISEFQLTEHGRVREDQRMPAELGPP